MPDETKNRQAAFPPYAQRHNRDDLGVAPDKPDKRFACATVPPPPGVEPFRSGEDVAGSHGEPSPFGAWHGVERRGVLNVHVATRDEERASQGGRVSACE